MSYSQELSFRASWEGPCEWTDVVGRARARRPSTREVLGPASNEDRLEDRGQVREICRLLHAETIGPRQHEGLERGLEEGREETILTGQASEGEDKEVGEMASLRGFPYAELT